MRETGVLGEAEQAARNPTEVGRSVADAEGTRADAGGQVVCICRTKHQGRRVMCMVGAGFGKRARGWIVGPVARQGMQRTASQRFFCAIGCIMSEMNVRHRVLVGGQQQASVN